MPYLSVLSLFALLFLFGCKEEFTSGNFYRNPSTPELTPHLGDDPIKDIVDEDVLNPPKKVYSIEEILKTYSVAVPADILFVIDNSGSMQSHQNAVIANTAQFMNQFAQIPNLDWRMGLLSSSLLTPSNLSTPPYAGFPNTGVLDSSTVNAPGVFAAAVGQLGINGSGTEKFYDPVKQAFTTYPSFNRSGAILDLVFITDTDDQSTLTASGFKSYLGSTLGANKTVKLFGVFNQDASFTCPKTDNLNWLWATSKHLALITAGLTTKTYRLCEPDFGAKLLEVATDLVLSSAKAEIQLAAIIEPSSLVIKYNGKVLVLGSQYTYDSITRLIKFPNLDFANDPKLPVKIYYNLL